VTLYTFDMISDSTLYQEFGRRQDLGQGYGLRYGALEANECGLHLSKFRKYHQNVDGAMQLTPPNES
jgi:hypothetical protein